MFIFFSFFPMLRTQNHAHIPRYVGCSKSLRECKTTKRCGRLQLMFSCGTLAYAYAKGKTNRSVGVRGYHHLLLVVWLRLVPMCGVVAETNRKYVSLMEASEGAIARR